MIKLNKLQKIIISILLAIILFCIVIGGFQGKSFFNSVIYDPFMMIKYNIIDRPIMTIKQIGEDFSRMWDTLDENDKLKQEIAMQKQYEALYKEKQRELDELKELMDLKSNFSNYKFVDAEITYRDMELWNNFIVVNKGSNDGIKIGMAVINSKGMLGRVEEVQKNSSKIRLLSSQDKDNKVSVKVELNKHDTAEGILSGYDPKTGNYMINLFMGNDSVKPGQKVITSGQGGLYPSGFLIGTIDKTQDLNNQVGMTIYVKPAVNYSDFDYVSIIKS